MRDHCAWRTVAGRRKGDQAWGMEVRAAQNHFKVTFGLAGKGFGGDIMSVREERKEGKKGEGKGREGRRKRGQPRNLEIQTVKCKVRSLAGSSSSESGGQALQREGN